MGRRTMLRLVRPKKCAWRCRVARTISSEGKPRSHSSSMPGPIERRRGSAVGTSPVRKGRITASQMTCVPVSSSASTRIWGNARLHGRSLGVRRPGHSRACRRRRSWCRRSPSAAARPEMPHWSAPSRSVAPPPETPPGAGAPRLAVGLGRSQPCSAPARCPDAARSLPASQRRPRPGRAASTRTPTAPSPPPASPPGGSATPAPALARPGRLDRGFHRLVGDRCFQGFQQRPIPQPRRPNRYFPRPSAQRHRQPSRST